MQRNALIKGHKVIAFRLSPFAHEIADVSRAANVTLEISETRPANARVRRRTRRAYTYREEMHFTEM